MRTGNRLGRTKGVATWAWLVGLGLIESCQGVGLAQDQPTVNRPVAAISSAGRRLGAIIDALDVEHRWEAGRGVHWDSGLPDPRERQHATHCSAFVAAACRHLGVDLLHPPEHAQELLANAQLTWLEAEGKARGWWPVRSPVEAQMLANDGFVVVALYRNPDAHKPGHAAIVRPGQRDAQSVAAVGPDTAMAGQHNRNVIPLREAFASHPTAYDAGQIDLFAHASPVTGAVVAPVAEGPTAREVTHRVAAAARTAAEVVPAGTPTRLAAVMAVTLPRWASDGVVEKARLEALAADHRIRGEQAAALAALLHHFRAGVSPSWPVGEFNLMADRHQLDHSYRSLVEKLPRIRRTLFVDGVPHFDRLKQGPAGDCYLFSGAGWMARCRPRRLVEMIEELPNGRFGVRFASGESAVVAAPTDTEILYNESPSTLDDGLWMAVLEKAVGTIEGRNSPRKAAVGDPSLRVNLGGSAKADVHRWTGHAVDAFELKDHAQASRALEALGAMKRRHLMAQAVVTVTHPPGPLPMNHAYAVLDFDPTSHLVTIWNPWGDDFTPKGPAGVVHGWPRKHGVFTIPFHDFARVFAWLDVEHP